MANFTLPFERIGKEDTGIVGGKGANLGEMASFGMPVPPGFVVTAQAYREFLKQGEISVKLHEYLDHLDVTDTRKLAEASERIKGLIKKSPIPAQVAAEIVEGYRSLQKEVNPAGSRFHALLGKLGINKLKVAVRSSATSEDSKEASFAGQNETFLNISGEKEVVTAVRRCWASLFDGRSIFYRVENHFDHFESAIAVVVQTMVQSEVSGILFSIDPVTNNHERIVVEAVWGLGEYVVQGKVTPDHYEIDKGSLKIVEKKLAVQEVMLTRKISGTVREAKVPGKLKDKFKMSDEQISQVARLSLELEKHYDFPQDSEFAQAGGKIYLVQTRPITTTKKKSALSSEQLSKELGRLKEVLSGAPASPGVVSGKVQILKSAKEIGKIHGGEVLVAPQTNPDFVPAMKKAAAIVTDSGGRTSHAAIVSRELGIPCVVGTEKATKALKNGQMITVDGSGGKVYLGKVEIKANKESKVKESPVGVEIKTRTKVYVNLAEPEKAREVAALPCDGIGLLRAEFVLAGMGVHPMEAIARNEQKEFTNDLAVGLAEFARAFYPRPVVYRATDFKTNEYRSLKGGEKYEPHEENPMIGFRGAYRYVRQPEVFKMEIEAIKKVRTQFDNLWLMIPFCRTVKELTEVKELVNDFGLSRSQNFQLWMMCEVPSNVILLDEFIKVGIDGISVGSNDLTMLTLGVDRDNENVATEYSELDEAMLVSFEKIVKTCRRAGVTCSMCGQAPSDFPHLTEKLVAWGITSVSVNPDVVAKTRGIVAAAEKKLK